MILQSVKTNWKIFLAYFHLLLCDLIGTYLYTGTSYVLFYFQKLTYFFISNTFIGSNPFPMFRFDGQLIFPYMTPTMLEIEDGDIIGKHL